MALKVLGCRFKGGFAATLSQFLSQSNLWEMRGLHFTTYFLDSGILNI